MPNDGVWGIDDRTGFKVRLKDLKHEWTGLRVADPDRRNPADFVRAVNDDQSVKDARPEPADVFKEPASTLPSDL